MRTLLRLTLLTVPLVLAATPVPAHPPAAGPATLFASALDGPEGLAFDDVGGLIVGSITGDVLRFAPDGSQTLLANVGDRLAGMTVLRDGRILACAFGTNRIWSIAPDGATSVFVSDVPGANFVVETRTGQILASASLAGTIVDVTAGTPVVLAGGLQFPNGLAVARRRRSRFLYVVETLRSRVSRLPLMPDGSLGASEIYATGLPLADGIAFDRRGNLLVVGSDVLSVVDARTRAVTPLSTDPLLDWPANLAFGRRRGFSTRDVYLANFGPTFGDGTTIVRVRYNHGGAPLVR
jgi:sugar lactone lactonase YvrE